MRIELHIMRCTHLIFDLFQATQNATNFLNPNNKKYKNDNERELVVGIRIVKVKMYEVLNGACHATSITWNTEELNRQANGFTGIKKVSGQK